MGHKLLAKMGWKEGESLGKTNAGIREPVSTYIQCRELRTAITRGFFTSCIFSRSLCVCVSVLCISVFIVASLTICTLQSLSKKSLMGSENASVI